MTHALELAEQTIYPILDWLRLVFEIGAAAWIAIGFVIVVGALLREGIHREALHRDSASSQPLPLTRSRVPARG